MLLLLLLVLIKCCLRYPHLLLLFTALFICLHVYFVNINLQITNVDVDLNEYQGEPEFIAEKKCKEAAGTINGPVLVSFFS